MQRRGPEHGSRSLASRMAGAAMLRRRVYEDVAHDEFATLQAFQIVVMAAIFSAFGAAGLGQAQPMTAALIVVVRWVLLTYVVYLLGTWLLPGARARSGVAGLMRTTGFAQTPLILTFLAGVPYLGLVIWYGAQAWWAVATTVAVWQALDYRTLWPAIGIVVLATIPPFVVRLAA